MHTSVNRAPHTTTGSRQHQPRHGRLLSALAVGAALLGTAAGAQGTDAAQAAPVVGIHYQDLLPTDSDTIQVFLPRPQMAAWEGVLLSSSNECLELGELGDPGPDHVLILDVHLAAAGPGPGSGSVTEHAHGTACSATVVASYRSGDTAWNGATQVTVNRLAHPPAPDGIIEATLTLDRISMPVEPGARTLATLIDLTLTNRGTEPVAILGIADEASFTALVGSVYQYDEPLDGTLARLEAVGRALSETTLAPGDSTRIALVLDPQSRLPDGSAVLTVQPALIVSIADTPYSLRFERMSTAWGNELP
jgi:hypothetical protein